MSLRAGRRAPFYDGRVKPWPTSLVTRLIAGLSAALATALVSGLLVGWPAHGVTAADRLSVTITDVGPATLSRGNALTIGGTVTNFDDQKWTSLQAYVAVPTTPFASRDAMATATAGEAVYTGQRLVDVGLIDDIGDLAAGRSATFQIRVPWRKLGFTGAAGVYPVGVQILATAPDGSRSGNAVGRATTFVPLMARRATTAPATLVWPLLLPSQRRANGDYRTDFVASLDRGGQLRNLLALAESAPRNGSTLLLDPALLDAAGDIAAGRHTSASGRERRAAATFVASLRSFAASGSTWLLGYGQPDELALASTGEGARLRTAVDDATDATATAYGLRGRHVAWLSPGGASRQALQQLDHRPTIVSAHDANGWQATLGTVVTDAATSGPLVVIDDLTAGVPGRDSVATLRQSLLASAALASLSRHGGRHSAADAVLLVPPGFDPGPRPGSLAHAFDPQFVVARTLDSRLSDGRPRLSATFAPTVSPVGRAVLEAADRFMTRSAEALELTDQNPRLARTLADEAAMLTSTYWRGRSQAGVAAAQARADELAAKLDHLTIEAAPSFTLSGSQGRVPLTIANATNFAVRVGVKLDSSNPALALPDIQPVVIKAHERRTLTVTIDVGRQKASTVTSTLVTASGRHVGVPVEFNLRSSNVDAIVWLAMGAAALLTLLAFLRRMLARRRG